MNRISFLAILAMAGCTTLATEVKAQTSDSSHSGSVTATCSITKSPGDLIGTPNTINGGNFPTELTSTANPGKFTTLCNTASTTISVELSSFTKSLPGLQGATYTSTYSLSANSPSTYVGNSILGNDFTDIAPRTGLIGHSFSNTPSELIVSGKVKAATGKVLGNGTYTIVVTAILTPN